MYDAFVIFPIAICFFGSFDGLLDTPLLFPSEKPQLVQALIESESLAKETLQREERAAAKLAALMAARGGDEVMN